MKSNEDMSERAREIVSGILKRRMTLGGYPVVATDPYFMCEPQQPRSYEGGSEVRIRTWRYSSDAYLTFEQASGLPAGWSIPGFARPETGRELTETKAVDIVRKQVEIPPDAVLESFEPIEYSEKTRVSRLRWGRVHLDLPVHGDFITAVIHPETHRIIEYFRRWRSLEDV
jgi:hypothetical protein